MIVNKLFDTVIISLVVAGSTLLFTLARYEDIQNIIEPYTDQRRCDLQYDTKSGSQHLTGDH